MLPICVPTLNRGHDRLQALLETALRDDNEMQPSKIIVLDNGNQFPNAIDVSEYEDYDPELTKILVGTDKVITVSAGCNMGVSASWNWFLNNVPMDQGAMLISNDDVTFGKETLKMFYDKIKEPDVHFLLGDQSVWALYAITEEIFKDVGEFDENFYPAYFEDNDFAYRLAQKGYTITQDVSIHVGHQNSSTLAALSKAETDQHHINGAAYHYKKNTPHRLASN